MRSVVPAALALLLIGRASSAQLREPETQVVGNCFVAFLRGAPVLDNRLRQECQSGTTSSFQGVWLRERYGGWAPPFFAATFDSTESAMCGGASCLGSRTLRLVLYFDTLANAGSRPGSENALDIMESVVLVDFVQNLTTAVMSDALAEQNGQVRRGKYLSWLDSLRSRGGKECVLAVPRPELERTSAETFVRDRMAPAALVQAQLFGHEIAHALHGSSCGYDGDDQRVAEIACDTIALRALAAKGMAFPIFTIAVLVGMKYHEALGGPLLVPERTWEAYRETWAPRQWDVRGRALLGQWIDICRAGNRSLMCASGWPKLAQQARDYLDEPPPKPCVPAERSSSGARSSRRTPGPACGCRMTRHWPLGPDCATTLARSRHQTRLDGECRHEFP